MSGRLRVLQLVPRLQLGGLERLAVDLSTELTKRGHDVIVCTSGGALLVDELTAAGIEIATIARPEPHPGALLRSAWTVSRVLRHYRPDVVHAHNPAAAAAAWVARVIADVPQTALVATHHGVEHSRVRSAVRALGRCDVVVCTSPRNSDELVEAGLPRHRTTTVMNAVAIERRFGSANVRQEFDAVDAELVVTVGRYAEQKNHALLLAALGGIRPRRPRLRALLVGEGPLETELAADVRARELDHTVTLTGRRSDAVDLAAAADVFALSSRWEALPLAVLEALAVGTPVVAPAVGGIPDVIRDGETGLLVQPHDAHALGAAIERVLEDQELANRLATNGQAWFERRCSVGSMADRYVIVYADALARRRRRLPVAAGR